MRIVHVIDGRVAVAADDSTVEMIGSDDAHLLMGREADDLHRVIRDGHIKKIASRIDAEMAFTSRVCSSEDPAGIVRAAGQIREPDRVEESHRYWNTRADGRSDRSGCFAPPRWPRPGNKLLAIRGLARRFRAWRFSHHLWRRRE